MVVTGNKHDSDKSRALQVLTLDNGKQVKSRSEWETRRQEIVGFFSQNVYGVSILDGFSIKKMGVDKDNTLIFKPEGIIREKIVITVSDTSVSPKTLDIELYVFRSAADKDSVKPVIINLSHLADFDYGSIPQEDINNPTSTVAVNTYIKNGFNVAILNLNTIAANAPNSLQTGIFELIQPRQPHDGKTISAWAWGVSKAVDYLYTMPYVDKDKIAVVGHSRGGKTALWAGALDTRITAAISNNSGSTGAAMAYNNVGETIADINKGFPHWFCDNYRQFDTRQNELPFDQHMLLAAIAPRLLYVASSSLDAWADPKGELWAARLSSVAFELLGVKGLVAPAEEGIELGKGYHNGLVGYHRKEGKHSIAHEDWLLFLDFFRAKGWIV